MQKNIPHAVYSRPDFANRSSFDADALLDPTTTSATTLPAVAQGSACVVGKSSYSRPMIQRR